MTRLTVTLIVLSVTLTAIAQMVLKAGVTGRDVQIAGQSGSPVSFLLALALSWQVWAGLLAFGISVLMWLFVLSRVEVSTAYPFVALGMVLTTALGYFLFNESMSAMKVGGIALIALGVILVARGAQ